MMEESESNYYYNSTEDDDDDDDIHVPLKKYWKSLKVECVNNSSSSFNYVEQLRKISSYGIHSRIHRLKNHQAHQSTLSGSKR